MEKDISDFIQHQENAIERERENNVPSTPPNTPIAGAASKGAESVLLGQVKLDLKVLLAIVAVVAGFVLLKYGILPNHGNLLNHGIGFGMSQKAQEGLPVTTLSTGNQPHLQPELAMAVVNATMRGAIPSSSQPQMSATKGKAIPNSTQPATGNRNPPRTRTPQHHPDPQPKPADARRHSKHSQAGRVDRCTPHRDRPVAAHVNSTSDNTATTNGQRESSSPDEGLSGDPGVVQANSSVVDGNSSVAVSNGSVVASNGSAGTTEGGFDIMMAYKDIPNFTSVAAGAADGGVSPDRKLPGGGKGGRRHLIEQEGGFDIMMAYKDIPNSTSVAAGADGGAEPHGRELPGGGKGGRRHLREEVVDTGSSSDGKLDPSMAYSVQGSGAGNDDATRPRLLPGGGKGGRRHLQQQEQGHRTPAGSRTSSSRTKPVRVPLQKPVLRDSAANISSASRLLRQLKRRH